MDTTRQTITAGEHVAENLSNADVGVCIGPYKLLQKIGEGGFGEVWLAEQREPMVRRVALKIIKLGMDTRQVVARFEAERQALALMDHPHIAKVFDGGATENGRPYFVMELVKGDPITAYCDTNNVGTVERLRLFIQVCAAVQHAHQKGVIHRDIKPSNILVSVQDGTPVPKVIDFGIAKATQQQLTDKTLVTQFQQFIGTPAYMSPEQAEMTGTDVDTRTDIYSLGVLLYELLTGTTPFDSKQLLSSGIDEMRRIIRQTEPPRPSTRLSQLAVGMRSTASHSSPKSGTAANAPLRSDHLLHALRGDLDWIVMKCLEKDRTRRYETANGLAMDLKRHLNHEPVIARPPTALYRLQKTALRHKTAFIAGAVTSLALLVTVFVSTAAAIRSRRAEQNERKLRVSASDAQSKAEAATLQARRHLYAADMLLAYEADAQGNLGEVRRRLQKYATTSDQGLRGWEWWHLAERSTGEHSLILRGHTEHVRRALFVPHQQRVATLCDDHKLRFFDSLTGLPTEQRDLWASTFAFSPDGRFLALPGRNLLLWDNGVFRVVEMTSPDLTKTFAAAFSPNNHFFAFVDLQAVRVYSVPAFQLVKAIPRPGPASVSFHLALAFLPDSSGLVYCHNDRRIVVHRLSDGLERVVGQTTTATALSLAVSPDGKFVAASDHKAIVVCDLNDGKLIHTLTDHREQIVSLAFSPDGTLLASASGDQTVRLWDTTTWKTTRIFRGHRDEVHSVDFSSDGRYLLSSGKDRTARIWDLPALSAREEHATVLWPWEFPISVANPHALVSGESETECSIVSLQHLKATAKLSLPSGKISALAASPDWTDLAVARPSGEIELYRGNPLAIAQTLHAQSPPRFLAVDQTLRRVAFVRGDGVLEIWDTQTGRLWPTLPAGSPPPETHELQFCARDKLLVRVCLTEQQGEQITVVDMDSGRQRRFSSTHNGFISAYTTTDDGQVLATSAWDATVRLWDIATGTELAALTGQFIGFTSVAFTQDGTRLAAGGWDGSITIWDMSSKQQVAKWPAHQTKCIFLEFINNDESLTSIGPVTLDSKNYDVRLWHAPKSATSLNVALHWD